MATYAPAKRNTAFVFYVGLVSQADGKVLQASPTLAAGDVKIAKDDGAPANLATLPAVDADFTKRVKVSLSATEMDADQVTILFVDAAGAEWCDLMVNIQTVARQYDDLAYPATSGRSIVVDAAGLVDANVVKVGPTGSGTAQTAGDIVGDTNDIQTRLPAALVSGRIDASVGAMAANTLTAAALAADAGAEIADAIWDEALAGHAGAGSAGLALAAAGALGSPLDAAGVRAAVGLAGANLDTQLSALAGFIDTEVASILSAVDTEVGAIKTKTDNLPDSPAAVGDAMTLTAAYDAAKTAAQAGDAMTLSVAERASVADKLLGRSRAGGADGGRTVASCLALGRNKWAISGTTLTVYDDDDATPLYTAEVTTAAGDPLTGCDPA